MYSLLTELERIASDLDALGHIQSDRQRLIAELRALVQLLRDGNREAA